MYFVRGSGRGVRQYQVLNVRSVHLGRAYDKASMLGEWEHVNKQRGTLANNLLASHSTYSVARHGIFFCVGFSFIFLSSSQSESLS